MAAAYMRRVLRFCGARGRRAAWAGLVGISFLLVAFLPAWAAAPPDGAALYTQYCASCHDGTVARAPRLATLRALSPEAVLRALEVGTMRFYAGLRPSAERRALATFVTGKAFGHESDPSAAAGNSCAQVPGELVDPVSGPQWNGWGANVANTRSQPPEQAGLRAEDIPRLRLKWAFGLPADYQVSQPTVVGGRVFIGSIRGRVYALDAKTGCLYWSIPTAAGVRTAISVGPLAGAAPPRYAAYFGDVEANVYAVDASTGIQLWNTRVEDHPAARITGAPVLHANRLYVPVSSAEELSGAVPQYECCTFRGSIVALEATTGTQVWKTYTIPQAPAPVRKNAVGIQLWGPSGAGVWASPTIDLQRGVLYVTTGDNYSDPPTSTSDAIVALDLGSGKVLWSRQFTVGDAYNIACGSPYPMNCPQAKGPDLDFGSSPMLRMLPNGKRVLLAGQKSGMLHAVDPDNNGAILWQQRVGQGGMLGGIQWGPAADPDTTYVALSDVRVRVEDDPDHGVALALDAKAGGGLFAYRIENGERKWATPPPSCGERPHCSPAQSAAITVIPGVVFSGSVDGHLRAYSTQDGRMVWEYDTARDYDTINGVKARGGALDGPGPVVAGSMLYVYSGYGVWGGLPGNVLLAFSVDGK